MARPVRGCLMPWSQQQGAEEPETNTSVPQQEEQSDATEGKVIADNNPNVDCEGSEPKNEPVIRKRKRKTLMQNMQSWR